MSDLIVVGRKGAIATVILNNPERRNALSREAWAVLADRMTEISADPTLRCVVVRGAGDKAFAAGADIAEFQTERSSSEQAAAYGADTARALDALINCQHPTIAMILGACTGGGLEIACCCDIRICNESARFGVPINRIGHPFAYPELAPVLQVAGRAAVLELLLEGRIVDAEWARLRGLVTRVVADYEIDEEIANTAAHLAEVAPLSMRGTKKFVNRLTLNASPLSETEIAESYAACDSEDYAEGVTAFLAKRKPVFRGQ
ncbi:MAG: enoyl-CoA hydratase/isomerase family protein [Rhodospirillaceae bacterium]|jgi:enoyl-CoA hydratase|nr:enoyl-CoA hydratase/isomerase family protein [Rhodospirillaceae bacterium]